MSTAVIYSSRFRRKEQQFAEDSAHQSPRAQNEDDDESTEHSGAQPGQEGAEATEENTLAPPSPSKALTIRLPPLKHIEVLQSPKDHAGSSSPAGLSNKPRDDSVDVKRVEDLEAQVQQLQQEVADAHKLSDIRASELTAAQTFLTTEDTISVAEVIRMVEVLNEEIYRTAAFIADTLVDKYLHTEAKSETVRDGIPDELAIVEIVLGKRMVELLHAAQSPEDAVTITQAALQAGLITWCYNETGSWSSDWGYHCKMRDLYKQVKMTGKRICSNVYMWPLETFEISRISSRRTQMACDNTG